ncbi:MAG: hypothetical protein QM740_16575 [Acidovorax sp.]
MDLSTMSDAELKDWRKQADELDILRLKTEMRLSGHTEWEFPVPFRFVDSPQNTLGRLGRPYKGPLDVQQIEMRVESKITHAKNSN